MSKTPEYFNPAHSLVIPAGIFLRKDAGEEDEDDDEDEEEQPRKHQEDEDDGEDEGYSP
jgi:hypothetical protein